MAITINFINRNVLEDGVRVYKSDTAFDPSSLPNVYATLAPGSAQFTDLDVRRGEAFYYLLETFRGEDSGFSELIYARGLPTETGPGPQVLMGGDHRAGFYGEVPVSDFIDGEALAALIGLTAGTAQFSDEPWLKFSLDGRTLFVSKKSYRHSISWDQINAVNAITGEREIEIGGDLFSIGLLKGLNSEPNPGVPYATGYDTEWTWGSEWNRLMYNVCEQPTDPLHHKHSQVGENWANYTQDELNITTGNGRYSWCQETSPLNSAQHVYRGYLAVSYLYSGTSSNTYFGFGWRPVLELVT